MAKNSFVAEVTFMVEFKIWPEMTNSGGKKDSRRETKQQKEMKN